MAAVSKAESTWRGGLADGKGEVKVASGAFAPFEVTWKARTEGEHGVTTPEELLAAAHSACFSMALSHALAQAGHPPQQLDVSAEVTFQPGEGIKGIVLAVRGRVPGIDAAAFREAAEGAKAGCPVSKALGGTEISLAEARLEG
ncbi:MAG: OsmC family peroxiredoxin [Chloroflexota bacterium]